MQEIQLALPIHQIDDDTLDNFYGDNNLLLLNSLQKNFVHLQQPFFYLWGNSGSGKTHLLKAISNHFLLQNRNGIYIPLDKAYHFSPAVLENLEQQDIVCLDDIQSVLGDQEWEIAIFDLFNRIRENGKTLLVISACCPLSQLSINLPDLRSRLSWGETYQLQPLDEAHKIIVLQRKARGLGFELPDETANFLLKRVDRDTHSLFQMLEKLDRASLQAQRKLTVPFVKEILHI